MSTSTERAPVVDDMGNLWLPDHYTERMLHADDVVVVGAFVPGVKQTYWRHKDDAWRVRESRKAFDAADANCNTCACFERIRHPKDKAGFLQGRCDRAPPQHPLQYRKASGVFWVHPNDAMLMDCYQERRESRNE